jgi:uncharacterized protein (TIGR02271 family)
VTDRRWPMRWTRNDVHDGMSVTSTKGDRLGKVISRGADTFVVEKGVFFPKDYELRYDHISDAGSGGITYSLSDIESRLGLTETSKIGTTAGTTTGTAASTAAAAASTGTARAETPLTSASAAAKAGTTTNRDELRIPLMEEEVGIEKVPRETGHVRIHKTIKTEEKHFSVPVTREDVVIERVAVSSDEPVLPPSAMFQEETLDVALHEEDVKVNKRSRLREEMVVRTVVEAVQKDASANLRHEECEIEDTRTGKSASWDRDTSPGLGASSSLGSGYTAPPRH